MPIYESAEDYLERILVLTNRQGSVKSVDLAREMGFAKASISVAMKKLKNGGYIFFDENNYIHLTDKGKEAAGSTYEKHVVLSKVFMSLGVNEETAKKDACRIEHYISEETFDAIKKHVKGKID